jgi:hypothetical protein
VLGKRCTPTCLIFSKRRALNGCVGEVRDVAALSKTCAPLALVLLLVLLIHFHLLAFNGSGVTIRFGTHVDVVATLLLLLHLLLLCLWWLLLPVLFFPRAPESPAEDGFQKIRAGAIPVRDVRRQSALTSIWEISFLAVDTVQPTAVVARLKAGVRWSHPRLGDAWFQRESIRIWIVQKPCRRLASEEFCTVAK